MNAIGLILAGLAALAPFPAAQQQDRRAAFDEVQGWLIGRRPNGCYMAARHGDAGQTLVTLVYEVDGADAPLTLLVTNRLWRLRDEEDSGYRIVFTGVDHAWENLRVLNFVRPRDNVGTVSIPFHRDAVVSFLNDFSTASGFRLFRRSGDIDGVTLRGTSAAMPRLFDCLRTFPASVLPDESPPPARQERNTAPST